jgi:hypothetical protein
VALTSWGTQVVLGYHCASDNGFEGIDRDAIRQPGGTFRCFPSGGDPAAVRDPREGDGRASAAALFGSLADN